MDTNISDQELVANLQGWIKGERDGDIVRWVGLAASRLSANDEGGVADAMVERFIQASSIAGGDTAQCVRSGLEAALTTPKPEATDDEDNDTSEQWRKLALQFDCHRIEALAMLRAAASGDVSPDDIKAFLATPPKSGASLGTQPPTPASGDQMEVVAYGEFYSGKIAAVSLHPGRHYGVSLVTLEAANKAIADRDRHIEYLQERDKCCCGCAYDRPDDVCLGHSPKLKAAEARIEELEKALARRLKVNRSTVRSIRNNRTYKGVELDVR